MIPFQPDPAPESMPEDQAEWILRQLRRISEFTTGSSVTTVDNSSDIDLLKQHPPRTDNPHSTTWDNLLAKPSCPVNWAGEWFAGAYQRCDMVNDSAWLAIANKDTDEKPAPQPTGDRTWASEIPGTPAWALDSATASQLVIGQRYTWDIYGYLTAVRVDAPAVGAGLRIELWLIRDPLGTPAYDLLIPEFTPDSTGWVTVLQGLNIVEEGTVFDVIAVLRDLGLPTNWTGTWVYNRANGAPIPGEANHWSGGGSLAIHHFDDVLGDRQTELEALRPGDDIDAGGIVWNILSYTHETDHVVFGVEPSTRAAAGTYLFTFTTYGPQPIAYNNVTDHFLSESQVDGLYSETGYENVVLDDNAYGVDIEVEAAIISPDWDLIAYSG